MDRFSQQWAIIVNTWVLYIQFVGLFSFVKRWFILSKSAGYDARPGKVAKGLMYIIGRIVVISFMSMATIINNTIFAT